MGGLWVLVRAPSTGRCPLKLVLGRVESGLGTPALREPLSAMRPRWLGQRALGQRARCWEEPALP